MKLFRKNKHYVSPIDKFFTEFDKKYPEKSRSQRDEIKKYERIYELRNNKES